ncbi:phage holin family protein [Kineococcus rhizosphaerae]|uniref:Putative superfamily III holin-X n=1 Tax=Kineococcus rhizosphaerae TaxID=559628 RepID=A0A2T0QXN0_9ACTN|nr:phage holin family protein [Kineococcus rhizosphaerae]PRY10551.1 putative superfamily III holin-X [Kineococcus rhizosphaerae]
MTGGATAVPPPSGAPHGGTADDRSIGEIVGSITGEFSTLVRQEITLARAEATRDAKVAGKGAGMLAGAGVAGHLFLISLSALVVIVLGRLIGYGWSALIVTVVWAVVAAILASRGRAELKKIPPPLEETQKSLKEDAQWLKNRNS